MDTFGAVTAWSCPEVSALPKAVRSRCPLLVAFREAWAAGWEPAVMLWWRWRSPRHVRPPLPSVPVIHAQSAPPPPTFLHSMKFFFPAGKSVSGQPHFPLCLWGLLMSLVRLQTDWITSCWSENFAASITALKLRAANSFSYVFMCFLCDLS